jgi:hypothetical protein
MNPKRIGGDFDYFLHEQKLLKNAEATAVKRVMDFRLAQGMQRHKKTNTVKAQTMKSLIKKAKEAFESAPSKTKIRRKSIPILYFGNYLAFRKSKLRIVTVGKNPSDKEFPANDPWQRFPAYKKSHDYESAWNEYFAKVPYDWFSAYKNLLDGFDASFYPDQEKANTAIHTDLLSPVATFPTWSKLDKSEKESLAEYGVPLWHELIKFLKPHIILVSFASEYKERINCQNWQCVHEFTKKKDGSPRCRPYQLMHAVMKYSRGKYADIIFGQGRQKPFWLCNDDKSQIASILKNKKILKNKNW